LSIYISSAIHWVIFFLAYGIGRWLINSGYVKIDVLIAVIFMLAFAGIDHFLTMTVLTAEIARIQSDHSIFITVGWCFVFSKLCWDSKNSEPL
jgi:hypothetical protein